MRGACGGGTAWVPEGARVSNDGQADVRRGGRTAIPPCRDLMGWTYARQSETCSVRNEAMQAEMNVWADLRRRAAALLMLRYSASRKSLS